MYVSRDDCIRGHFLTCYTAVTLIRMVQKRMFRDRYTAEEIIDYIRRFRAYGCGNGKWMNLMKRREAKIGEELSEYFQLPVLSRTLTADDIDEIFVLEFGASSRK